MPCFLSSAEEIAARDHTDDGSWSSPGNDWKPADVLAEHVIDGFPRRVIVEDDDGRPPDEVGDDGGERQLEIEEVASRDDADDLALGVNYREPLMR